MTNLVITPEAAANALLDVQVAGGLFDSEMLTTSTIYATITGTATASITEADVVAGGKTIIITLTGDTWIAAGGLSFDLQRLNIIQGLDSAQSEALGWNLQVRDTEVATAVVRTSDTVVTITLSVSPLYDITAQETITVTVPATALTGGNPLTGSPTFTVSMVASALIGARSNRYPSTTMMGRR